MYPSAGLLNFPRIIISETLVGCVQHSWYPHLVACFVEVDFNFLNVTGTLIGFDNRQKRNIIISKLQADVRFPLFWKLLAVPAVSEELA